MTDLAAICRSAAGAVLERIGRGMSRVQERTPLASDLLASDDAYLVVFDAPGAEPSDVQVRYVDGAVQVRVDRFREFHEGFETRFPGRGLSLSGEAELPGDAAVDADAAEATLTDAGELHVRVPKSDEATDVAVDEEGAPAEDEDDAAGVDDEESGDGTDETDPDADESETDDADADEPETDA